MPRSQRMTCSFGAHEQFLEGIGQAPLQEDGLVHLAQLSQQVEVLHVPGAHLEHVHILKEGQVRNAHYLGDEGQAGLLAGDLQKLQAGGLEAGEVVGGGAGLEGAAPKYLGSGGLDGLGHGDNLLFALHGAGAGDHDEVAAAYLHALAVHVFRVELAVAALEGLGDPLYGFHDLQTAHQVHVHPAGVAYEAQDGLIGAHGDVDLQSQVFQPANELVPLVVGHAVFEYNYHFSVLRLIADLHPGAEPGNKKMLLRRNLCSIISNFYSFFFASQITLTSAWR